MIDTASQLYNELLKIYFDEYYNLSHAKRGKMNPKYVRTNLALKDYNYGEWFTEESDYSTVREYEEELDDLPSLEGDQEIKVGKVLKISTPNKL